MRVLSSWLVLAGTCFVATDAISAQAAERVISPTEAIVAAADAAMSQRGVSGVFEMQVRATGRQDGLLYLNSELDYRDQRSLTVAITPIAERGLRDRFGPDVISALSGQRIQVTGAAQRVTIWFYCDGKRTEKYYFQTQVGVSSAGQIKVLPGKSSSLSRDGRIGAR